jgi:hypothetical protein
MAELRPHVHHSDRVLRPLPSLSSGLVRQRPAVFAARYVTAGSLFAHGADPGERAVADLESV